MNCIRSIITVEKMGEEDENWSDRFGQEDTAEDVSESLTDETECLAQEHR